MARLSRVDLDDLAIILTVVIAAVLGLLNVIFLFFTRLHSVNVPSDTKENKQLVETAEIIKNGAMAFLMKEYSFLLVFVVLMGVVVGCVTQDGATICSFIVGAFLSASCGWIGMRVAVAANYRTTYMASQEDGLNKALKVAFASGSVMGFGVVCSGILGLIIMWAIFGGYDASETRYLAGFGFGASSIALFARVGGGIYTKAADVGADLVGKVEAGLPEDDPRNPATIADNVGDNVGDVAGMGADLFESFVGGIIAAVQLSGKFYDKWVEDNDWGHEWNKPYEKEKDIRTLIALPFFVSAFGIVSACIGIYFVRTGQSGASGHELQEALLWTIRLGIFGTSLISTGFTIGICAFLFGTGKVCWELWGCTFIGLVAGVSIGNWTEYATSFTYKPTQTIAKKGKLGPAPVVIQGIGIGMLSTMGPMVIIFASILGCYELAGVYGIAIAAVGMLSTLGITLATDAFGPVADNAGGLAEMCEFPEAVRDTTDGLDALGNTTAATGKGFAIGSAVLSALALLNAFKTDSGLDLVVGGVDFGGIDVSKSEVLAGAIWGSCLPFIFAALTMMAVGRAATMMIEEVRAQIRKYDLLSENWKKPDYDRCVAISTQASVYEMIIPGLLACIAPLFIGFFLGPEALGGMLVGGITSGFMLAVYMANAGGAWDNAKKWVEAGQMQYKGQTVKKGSEIHAAVVSGDTIGDPFKDTSGPALNILMKLMTMISLVFAPEAFKGLEKYEMWWVATIIMVVFLIITVALTLWMRGQGFGKIKDLPEQDGSSAHCDSAGQKASDGDTELTNLVDAN